MANFTQIEEAGNLEISVTGDRLDVFTLGVIYLNLQDIFDKVTFRMLSEAGLVEPSWKRPHYLPTKQPQTPRRYIRAEVQSVKIGSWESSVVFAVKRVLADANVVAILQNLAANVIWAISACGVRGLRRKNVNPPDTYVWRQRNDPIEIGPNLRDVMLALSEHNQGRECVLTFKHVRGAKESIEVSISIDGDQ